MQVRKYLAESLPKALVKAKSELGSDIVILETKNVINHPDYPGQRMIQATVGLEKQKAKKIEKWVPPTVDSGKKPKKKQTYPELTKKYNAAKNMMHPEEKKEKPAKKTSQFDNLISDILSRKPQELNKEKDILDEISLLRKEIKDLGKKSDLGANQSQGLAEFPAVYDELREMLSENGIQDDMAYALIKEAYLLLDGKAIVEKNEIVTLIKTEMDYLLKPFNFERQLKSKKQKVILLLGPTGVGKTTMAMKLAAHPEIYGNKKVTIISTDPYGPTEALKSFSRMSGTQIHEEKDIDQTEAMLEKYKSSDVLIVDTPGQSPFAPNQLGKMESFIKRLKPTDIFLVLSVGSDLKDLVLLCANYLLLKPSGIVFTKFDETTQPGKVFSILDVISLPVACFGDGKRIFIDIERGNPQYMYDKIFDSKVEEA
jgi:flagellar biosynthesis protein FlhF